MKFFFRQHTMSEKFVTVTKSEGVMTILLNRPQQGNALRLAMYRDILEALQDAQGDDAVEVVIVSGKGPFFSTGADVTEAAERVMAGEGLESLQKELRHPVALTAAMIQFPKLLVAAVNGPVIGYPAAQLGLYDLVLISPTATFQVPLLHLGLVTEGCCSLTLPATVGMTLANDLLLTGRVLTAPEMVQVGIASRIVETALAGGSFLEAVRKIVVDGCLACSKTAYPNAKALLKPAEWRERLLRHNEAEAKALVAQFVAGEPMEKFAEKFEELQRKKKASAKKPASHL